MSVTTSSTSPVQAEGLRPDPPPRARLFSLKDGDMFVVTDSVGDICGNGDGLFRNDTRVLSYFQLRIGGIKPTVLNTARSRDNVFLTAHMVNRPLGAPVGEEEGVVHIERTKLLWGGALHERLICTNYGGMMLDLPLLFRFEADFADIFEVRGARRSRRGTAQPRQTADDEVLFVYEGLDHVVRTLAVSFSEAPARLSLDEAQFSLRLVPGQPRELYLAFGDRGARPGRDRFRRAAVSASHSMRRTARRGARVKSSGLRFNEWLEFSRSDLALLTTEMKTGPFPYAGIPWFSTAFGRDSIITALQTLWLDPEMSRGVLSFLASTQATEYSTFKDAEPGKIMHETRKGEMTTLGEVPFGQYYGGIDATPLFVLLCSSYADRTGDMALVEKLWPNINAALGWIESVLDGTGRGLLAYSRGEKSGLANQGWKDSGDSIFHADGTLAQGPIALVEVQGYAYAAFHDMAQLAKRRDDRASAIRWLQRAEDLRRQVEDRFWMDDAGFYGIAIDGAGELCRVRASNPGHLLYSGLPSMERGRRVVRTLRSNEFDSGWGIRTLAAGEARYNPMSYHNGSIWPHDTALCIAGAARYGERASAVTVMNKMFEAAAHFGMQLPELFCGFPRTPGEPPVHYPVACLPQAWAAGAPFMMLQACLGLRVNGWNRTVTVDRPWLPIHIHKLAIHDLVVGDKTITLRFERLGSHVVVVSDRTEHRDVPVEVIL
jgi:glycogen debranching enzyme